MFTVGCGVRGAHETKDFASGTVVAVHPGGPEDWRISVVWYWSGNRVQEEVWTDSGGYQRTEKSFTYEKEPLRSLERPDRLVLMSVPDHDHQPPNRWVRVVEVVKEARAQECEGVAKMLERWVRGEVNDEQIKDVTKFCEEAGSAAFEDDDLRLFVCAQQAAGIWMGGGTSDF